MGKWAAVLLYGFSVELSLGLAPTEEAAVTVAKDIFTALRSGLENISHGWRHWKLMRPAVLASLSWQRDYALPEVNLRPTQTANFIGALSGQDQQTNDVGI